MVGPWHRRFETGRPSPPVPMTISMNGFSNLSSALGLRYGRRMCLRPTILRVSLFLTALGCQGEPKGVPLVPPTSTAFDPAGDDGSETGSTHGTGDGGPPPDSGEPVPPLELFPAPPAEFTVVTEFAVPQPAANCD